ncbi:MAG: SRPBCC family protein [Lentimicrobium sp.]|jgi:ligand-binding SRPBCC domain-containing protein|nr:SRPBCC family protein [Lentimicrobium sp.]MDD2526441.1 SRPBCC family protein [Lentimicrobiaceae bacterium]MDD4597327.1 SRPBCC family protein [Lentimicrobiaceae bacterium]MDY0027157.1 SRPBCC family protein [Lentimicrobium sp.]HAH60157.1 hypothetical protein [Bacteroidales bacterium]
MPVFEVNQVVKANLEIVWSFFTDPTNLSVITPADMGFVIKFPLKPTTIYPGMIIKYKVSPLLSIPVEWVTEIAHVDDRHIFVDTQLKGPFKLWHHQHIFKDMGEVTEMTDIVNYEMPFGRLGDLLAGRMVRKRLDRIFKYRQDVVERIFNK